MLNFSEVFIYTDQPTTCPKCGSRTDFILDLSHTVEQTQIHQCLDDSCKFEFVMQKGGEEEDQILLEVQSK